MRTIILATILLLLNFQGLPAQGNGTKKSVFEKVGGVDSVSGGYIRFYNDKRLEKAVIENRNGGPVTISGYRLQVFSSNTQRTARESAFKIEQELKEVFPEIPVYVNYIAPFWKVRMGDFRSIEDAKKFRTELLDVFPELRSETYTVRDQINPGK